MLILGIETSTRVSSVAVVKDNVLAGEFSTQTASFHSETLAENIASLLNAVGANRRELTGIAVNKGPGSFTGLRIGLATAKAMAYALNIPLVGIEATQVLARGLWGTNDKIYSLIDAQKMSAYVEPFTYDGGNLHSVAPISIMPLKDFAANLADEGKVILTGDAAGKITDILPQNALVAPPDKVMPTAASVALLGEERLTRGESDDVMRLEPLYLRRSEAEILWDKKHG